MTQSPTECPITVTLLIFHSFFWWSLLLHNQLWRLIKVRWSRTSNLGLRAFLRPRSNSLEGYGWRSIKCRLFHRWVGVLFFFIVTSRERVQFSDRSVNWTKRPISDRKNKRYSWIGPNVRGPGVTLVFSHNLTVSSYGWLVEVKEGGSKGKVSTERVLVFLGTVHTLSSLIWLSLWEEERVRSRLGENEGSW